MNTLARNRQFVHELALRHWKLRPDDVGVTAVVTTQDMATLGGFTRGTMGHFTIQENFPAPFARQGKRVLFWRKSDFDNWLRAYTRAMKRPATTGKRSQRGRPRAVRR